MGSVPYQRARFATELPADCRYTPSHCWLRAEADGVWRIGFTKLATWLLGNPVEFEFKARAGVRVAAGEEIGWVEGLKAVHTIHAAAEGEFLGAGDGIRGDITLMESEPYGRGWLYCVRGKPAPDSIDVQAYIAILDDAIDRVLRARQAECGEDCES
jgi:glycine cleavage system H protein